MSAKGNVLLREEQLMENTWALEDLYGSDEAWEAECSQLEKCIEEFQKYKEIGTKSGKNLYEMLEKANEIQFLLTRTYVYANQKLHGDMGKDRGQRLAGKASALQVSAERAKSFIAPLIQAMSEEEISEYVKNYPKLDEYKLTLNRIMEKKAHCLSEEMEELLADVGELSDAPSDIFDMFNNADLEFQSVENEKGEKMPLTHGRYQNFLENENRDIRKKAFLSMYSEYEKYKNTLAGMFDANVRQAVFFAKTRKYQSSLEASLGNNHVPVAVYHNLIRTVQAHMPLMHRYVRLRKKALGVEELHHYDIQVPLVSEVPMNIDYKQAQKLVYEGLQPLGDEYQELLKEGFNNRWIDVYENKGKRSGAYSWGAYGTHPYVLLNYQDNLYNVFTLAHEMGHAIHSYYSNKNQPFQYAGYKIFVAEVASTCNEALLIHYMIEKAKDKKEKAYLINYYLEQFRATLYRQTMFAQFEMEMHERVEAGDKLTAQTLCDTYQRLVQEYFGEDMCADKEIFLEWARIPHFYNPFYVYQYATGFSAAIAISNRILTEGEAAVEDYKKFLKGGSSMTPIELLKLCKIDMEGSQPIEAALQVFEEHIAMLEQLLWSE